MRHYTSHCLQADLFSDSLGALDAGCDLLGEPFGLPDHSRSTVQELGVARLQSLLTLRETAAACAAYLHHPTAHGARAVAQRRPGAAGELRDALHRTGQHPYA